MLTASNELSVTQLIAIDNLLQACKEHDGDSLPIYRHLIAKRHPIACNLLYYQGEELAGYLRSFFFFENACEITLMVAPKYRRQKIATQLIKTIIPIMQKEFISKLIFSTPSSMHSEWLKDLGMTYRNSEYHMRYNSKLTSVIKPKPAKIRFAAKTDIQRLCEIDNAAFPNKKIDPESIFKNLLRTPNCDIFVLSIDDKVIGKAHIFSEPDKVRLTDIGIDPEYRSQGHGSALIKHCLNFCLMRNKTNIVLDVETNNLGALRLYKNLGFETVNSHDYWFTAEGVENFGLNKLLVNKI